MSFDKLTPEEEVIFGLIAMQREQSDRNDDCFIYSIKKGQRVLQSNGYAKEYGIGCPEQAEIIRGLSEKGIIDADWITSGSDSAKIKFEFMHHKEDWMWEKYGTSLMLFDSKDCEDSYFIQISFKRIKAINDQYVARYLSTLSYDSQKNRFIVKTENGDELIIKK